MSEQPYPESATVYLVIDLSWTRPRRITAFDVESALSQYCSALEVGALPSRIQVFELTNERTFRSVIPSPVLEEVVHD